MSTMSHQPVMIEVNTADLVGQALNYCVGAAEGHNVYVETVAEQMAQVSSENFTVDEIERLWAIKKPKVRLNKFTPCPDYSSDWSHCGPLIHKHRIGFDDEEGMFLALFKDPSSSSTFSYGSTHLIAACRVIVSAKFGASVSVPADLVI